MEDFITNHILIAILIALGSAYIWNSDSTKSELFSDSIHPNTFLSQLILYNYFQYTEEENIEIVEAQLTSSLVKNKGLSTVFMEDEQSPMDYRFYFLNGYMLLEKGGASKSLQLIKPTFDKLNISLIWANEYTLINEQIDFGIILNGKQYSLYKGTTEANKKNDIAVRSFVDMINDQLQKHDSKERLFLISNDIDCAIIFLNKELQEFIATIIKNKNIQPLDSRTWAKWNRLI